MLNAPQVTFDTGGKMIFRLKSVDNTLEPGDAVALGSHL